jgi:hypothetical protein
MTLDIGADFVNSLSVAHLSKESIKGLCEVSMDDYVLCCMGICDLTWLVGTFYP